MLQRNSEMLKQGTIEIAEESEKETRKISSSVREMTSQIRAVLDENDED